MRMTKQNRVAIAGAALLAVAGLTGCKSLNERYIALEVWKYEKCFGHLPPGFVPPNAAPAAPAMRPCGQQSDCCSQAPCHSASFAPGNATAGGCNDCQGGVGMVEGGMPTGAGVPAGAVSPSLPAGPGGSPGPMTGGAVTTGKPVIISDEVVLP